MSRQQTFTKAYHDIAQLLGTDAAVAYGYIEGYVNGKPTFKLTHAHIAKRHGWSLRTTERIIAKLRDAGLITVTLRGPQGCQYAVHNPEDVLDQDDEWDQDPETGRVYRKKTVEIPANMAVIDEEIPANCDVSVLGYPRQNGGDLYKGVEYKTQNGFGEPTSLSLPSVVDNEVVPQTEPGNFGLSSPRNPLAGIKHPTAPEPYRMWLAYCEAAGLDSEATDKRTRSRVLGIAKRLRDEAGFNAQDVYDCTKFLMTQDFRGEIIAFEQVARNIVLWRMKGRPKEDRRRGERINWQAGGTGRLVI